MLENPDRISKAVLARQLDSQTAFEIVSIDIADIDVGDNIGARLQADQAEADTRVARARAEGRRAMAVPPSRKTSPRSKRAGPSWSRPRPRCPRPWPRRSAAGKLGILDYYKLRNVQADTDMRRSIASVGRRRPAKT